MLAKQYSHRLPADYDMNLIRQRASNRGPLWDDTEGLAFKAFAARFKGINGAPGNVYSSIYLWLDVNATTDFILSDRFKAVIEGFGRPEIETWLPVDVRRGTARQGKTLYRKNMVLAENTDFAELAKNEAQRNTLIALKEDTVAVISAIDVSKWRLIRLTLSSAAFDPQRPGAAFDVLHLAAPGLDALP